MRAVEVELQLVVRVLTSIGPAVEARIIEKHHLLNTGACDCAHDVARVSKTGEQSDVASIVGRDRHLPDTQPFEHQLDDKLALPFSQLLEDHV